MGWKKDTSSNTSTDTPDSYVNIAIPLKDGSNSKIDRGLRLYFDRKDGAQHKALTEMLQTPEGIEKFRAAIVITCNYANVEKAEFAF